jgi:hypothetical protein
MGFSYYQDAGEEEERPPDRWASVRLCRLFLSLETLSSTAAVPTMYSVFYLYQFCHTAYFPFLASSYAIQC